MTATGDLSPTRGPLPDLAAQERVFRFLEDPRTYPYTVEDLEVFETHISRVVLAGPFAYKVKKALLFDFLDYSTVEKRRHFCEEEIRLNRRLAPEVYCDVVSIQEVGGALRLVLDSPSSDHEIEPVVRMKRVLPDATLAHHVTSGTATRSQLDSLVSLLCPFYEGAERSTAGDGPGSPQVVRKILEENHASLTSGALDPRKPGRLQAIRSRQLSFLELHQDLFESRLRDGWVRDGHGDLRAEHVVYLPRCAVLDCVEFNEDYRVVDILSDLAFLRMDLESLGAPELGEHLIARYSARSGCPVDPYLLEFYTSYRAFVRAKVDGLRAAQTDTNGPERARLLTRSDSYLDLSLSHAEKLPRPPLVTVGGLSGSGKSTLAKRLASRLGVPLLRSDEIRKEIAGHPPTHRPQDEDGLYTPEHTEETYRTVCERARDWLQVGAGVVVDATFSRRKHRDAYRDLGAQEGVRQLHFECHVAPEEAARRMHSRASQGTDPSDAVPELQENLTATYEPCLEGEAIRLDTTSSPEKVEEEALHGLRQHFAATNLAPTRAGSAESNPKENPTEANAPGKNPS